MMSDMGKRIAPDAWSQPNSKALKTSKTPTAMSPGRLDQNIETATDASSSDVIVVGAGPAGLMLAANLIRFGIKTTILDDRPSKTSTGRADGLQPKTIETLRQMRLAGPLLERGARVHDICFWSSSSDSPLRRTGREAHYPPVVDLLDPYILLVHQGMVEDIFLGDLESRGAQVKRSATFQSYTSTAEGARALKAIFRDPQTEQQFELATDYLVGCDGAHSQVRRCIPGAVAEGASSEAIWGVLDGEIETDFPDLWSKAVIYSHQYGNVLCIPRERNMTRLYIELKGENGAPILKAQATQEYVIEQARLILQPYKLSFTTIEWFGIYSIGQRVASKFADDRRRVFHAGDASHSHSPKAAQGMNTGMHDSLNLAWKLNLVIRDLASSELLSTYENERRKVAQDLINFDYEHPNAFHAGDPDALAQNFLRNIRFISGVGAEYEPNDINLTSSSESIQPGCLLTPARATRYVDANPVDLQLDIPMLGQFRIYFLCPDLASTLPFLRKTCADLSGTLSRPESSAALSYLKKPASRAGMEEYTRPERYLAVSRLFTLALITGSSKSSFEISDLPPLLAQSRWTIYLDDVPEQSTTGEHCLQKWIGSVAHSEVAILIVRPDGYVGSVKRYDADEDATEGASQ